MTVSKPNITIKCKDYNSIALEYFNSKNDLLSNLRKLTLHPNSGMNRELDSLYKIWKERKVEAKVILAYIDDNLVGWGLLSKESSTFKFKNHFLGYKPEYGTLFEIFVHPNYRRMGVGKKIVQTARKKTNNTTLCFCPWDVNSRKFYEQFNKYNHKIM